MIVRHIFYIECRSTLGEDFFRIVLPAMPIYKYQLIVSMVYSKLFFVGNKEAKNESQKFIDVKF
jgi:hypothetical protein